MKMVLMLCAVNLLSLFMIVCDANKQPSELNQEVQSLQKKIGKELIEVKKKHPDSRLHVYKALDLVGKVCGMCKESFKYAERYKKHYKSVCKMRDEAQKNEHALQKKVHQLEQELTDSKQNMQEQHEYLLTARQEKEDLKREADVIKRKEKENLHRMQVLEESLRKQPRQSQEQSMHMPAA